MVGRSPSSPYLLLCKGILRFPMNGWVKDESSVFHSIQYYNVCMGVLDGIVVHCGLPHILGGFCFRIGFPMPYNRDDGLYYVLTQSLDKYLDCVGIYRFIFWVGLASKGSVCNLIKGPLVILKILNSTLYLFIFVFN